MSDILSQSEIDELLKAIDSGNTEHITIEDSSKGKEAKVYNFKRPSKFSKEHLRTLEIIFEGFSRMVSSFLSGYLRTNAVINVASAEQLTYSDFSASLVNPVILSIVRLNPLKGSIIVELSSNIGFSMIDRILGGPGVGVKKVREFSEIEVILLERIVTQMLNFLSEPWGNVAKLTPELNEIETNSQFAQIIAPNEMIALVTLNIKIGSSEGLLNFCIPHIVVEPIMKRLNTKFWFSKNNVEDDSAQYKEELSSSLEKAVVPVTAVIGRTSIAVSDFVHLQAGDIITLDSFVNSDFNVMVGNLLKFRAKPGISRGKNSMQITSFVGKEEL
ncbi:MAG: flagellar motor switch protein FliM [Clostridiales bacterium]|nr:flagellar motor switch protein FliM [Clostridiales bacterium]